MIAASPQERSLFHLNSSDQTLYVNKTMGWYKYGIKMVIGSVFSLPSFHTVYHLRRSVQSLQRHSVPFIFSLFVITANPYHCHPSSQSESCQPKRGLKREYLNTFGQAWTPRSKMHGIFMRISGVRSSFYSASARHSSAILDSTSDECSSAIHGNELSNKAATVLFSSDKRMKKTWLMWMVHKYSGKWPQWSL